MKRTMLGALGAVLLAASPTAAGVSAAQMVAAGYDLYQLDFPFFPAALGTESGGSDGGIFIPDGPIGYFDDVDVVSNPLGMFDFGSGPVDVGSADFIVRRDAPALSDGTSGPVTVPIELVALSLRSVEPVYLPDESEEFLYFELDPSAPSTGQYDFYFAEFGDEIYIGDMSAGFTLNYRSRIGSPDGPVHETGSVFLGTDFGFGSVAFSHYPEGLTPFNEPDHAIDGVNIFLNGFDQESDFFQLGLPMTLQNFDDGGGEDFQFFELAFEHANSADPGVSPDNPVLPDDIVGGSFRFNDAPQEGWFDPPATSGFHYETDGASNFVSMYLPDYFLVPDADGEYVVSSVHGDVTVFAGNFYTFPAPVTEFTITGIDPTVDGGDPLAFPLYLTFDEFMNTFTQTPTAIPEPATVVLLTWFLGVVGASRTRSS